MNVIQQQALFFNELLISSAESFTGPILDKTSRVIHIPDFGPTQHDSKSCTSRFCIVTAIKGVVSFETQQQRRDFPSLKPEHFWDLTKGASLFDLPYVFAQDSSSLKTDKPE